MIFDDLAMLVGQSAGLLTGGVAAVTLWRRRLAPPPVSLVKAPRSHRPGALPPPAAPAAERRRLCDLAAGLDDADRAFLLAHIYDPSTDWARALRGELATSELAGRGHVIAAHSLPPARATAVPAPPPGPRTLEARRLIAARRR